jgi:regulation of enolase protein 1 (concanavalin A-like superfamily)
MTRAKGLVFFCSLSLCLILQARGQQNHPVKMPGIPFQMYWENNPVSYSVSADRLTIEAGEKTDMFRDPNATYNTDNAPKLLFVADSNFVLTASVEHAFENKWDGGAIVLKADSKNWIKFCFEKDYTGARRVVSVVTKDISDDCNSVALSGDRIFFKVARAGKVITLYYAEDGKNWFLIRHLQFEPLLPLQVGFLAQSPTGQRCKVTFADLKYEARKIRDPYAGE